MLRYDAFGGVRSKAIAYAQSGAYQCSKNGQYHTILGVFFSISDQYFQEKINKYIYIQDPKISLLNKTKYLQKKKKIMTRLGLSQSAVTEKERETKTEKNRYLLRLRLHLLAEISR